MALGPRDEEGPIEARAHGEALVFDTGLIEAAAQVYAQVGKRAGLKIELRSLALGVSRVDQSGLVGFAADRSELLVADIIVKDVEGDGGAAIKQFGLDSSFVRGVLFRLGDLDGLVAGRCAKARCSIARRDPQVNVGIGLHLPAGTDVPTDVRG